MSEATEKQAVQEGLEQAKAGEMVVFDLKALTHFRDEGPYVQVLSDVGAARLVLFAFKAGQQLKEHRTTSQIQVQVLRGRVQFTASDSSTRLEPGMVLQLEANVPHSVNAQTNAVMLLTMTPSPSYHSLEREVFQQTAPLVKRVGE